ncbi:MAG TPA: putative molybdenum carrier protein [Sumerlaeia bacterium]|nr:putative molybdenum carrier protein [Sumerlaeia bacterium]
MKIISGGQTGADRAALDVALELGVDCGGWCPRGRLAEDGVIGMVYPLRETESAAYDERTQRNVLDSDGTLVCNTGPLVGGTLLTAEFARQAGKPCLILNLDEDDLEEALWRAREWIDENGVEVLNVAGPRASGRPGIYDRTRRLLERLLSGEE